MTRHQVWGALIAAMIIYNLAKMAMGFNVWPVEEFIHAIYWSGAALLMHWLASGRATLAHR